MAAGSAPGRSGKKKAPSKGVLPTSRGQSQLLAPGQATTVVPGDPTARAAGQYGKGYTVDTAAQPDVSPSPPRGGGATLIRGAKGGVGSRIKGGGLGPGKLGAAGANQPAEGDNLE